jgi:hypothetical protein
MPSVLEDRAVRGPAAIGTLNEGVLHAQLKDWYRQPGDRVEELVDGFIVDLVRGELLVEIQTGSFAPLRRKLERLTRHHRVRLVAPVPLLRTIVRVSDEGRQLSSRRSPRRGRVEDIFNRLVSLPALLFLSPARNGNSRAAQALMDRFYGKPVKATLTLAPPSPIPLVLASMTLEEMPAASADKSETHERRHSTEAAAERPPAGARMSNIAKRFRQSAKRGSVERCGRAPSGTSRSSFLREERRTP